VAIPSAKNVFFDFMRDLQGQKPNVPNAKESLNFQMG
jgi:hypothetical protein